MTHRVLPMVLPMVVSAGATAAAGIAWAVRRTRPHVRGLPEPRRVPMRDSVVADLDASGRWS